MLPVNKQAYQKRSMKRCKTMQQKIVEQKIGNCKGPKYVENNKGSKKSNTIRKINY